MAHVLFSNVPLLKTCIGGLCPSLTFLQLGSYLQHRGHTVALHDVGVEQELRGEPVATARAAIVARVVRERPQVLGLSCKVPADGRFTRELVREVKQQAPDVCIVLGGIWASPCHRPILETMPEVDAVALGEGELALAALCDRLDRGLPPGGPEVPGLAYRAPDGAIQVTAQQPPLPPAEHPPLDLGLMPSPDCYTVFPYLTSKGCPFECTFCAECVIYPDHVETPLERLQEDLARLERFGRNYFLWLSDPLFGRQSRRTEAICRLLADSRFHFLLESRVDVLQPEQLPLLWEAGCELIYFGLESASHASLRRMNKIRSDRQFERYLAQARELILGCMRHDITPVVGIMNPVPGDTLDDLRQTYRFLEELARDAREVAGQAGTDPGYHFYGFDYRFIRGTPAFQRLGELSELGTTWLQDPDDIYRDVVIHDASPELPRAVALEFQRRIRGLVHTTPKGWERLQRSFPPQPLGGLG